MVPGMQGPRVGKALMLIDRDINWVLAAEGAECSVLGFGRGGFAWRSVVALGARRAEGPWPSRCPATRLDSQHAPTPGGRPQANWQPTACCLPPVATILPSLQRTHQTYPVQAPNVLAARWLRLCTTITCRCLSTLAPLSRRTSGTQRPPRRAAPSPAPAAGGTTLLAQGTRTPCTPPPGGHTRGGSCAGFRYQGRGPRRSRPERKHKGKQRRRWRWWACSSCRQLPARCGSAA